MGAPDQGAPGAPGAGRRRFADRVAMVTGASGMIGSACVAAFLAEGARVVALGHDHGLADGARSSGVAEGRLGSPDLLFRRCDLASDDDIEAAFAEAEARFGPVSVLVNNAAVYGRKPYLENERRDLARIFDVNVFGLLLAGRRAARVMIGRGIRGSIVNITSTSSRQSDALSVGYEASKGAVDAATRGMAVALAPHGIRVNAVGPGEMIKSQEMDNLRRPEQLSAFERLRIPLGRAATPQEVADAVLFLASEDARGIAGTILWVDGGTLGTWRTMAEEGDDG
jgi:NAD(P)-dependent dehydrogenase (short-subunit alcohol dehydrogenase family)